jgi:hypothetical protein
MQFYVGNLQKAADRVKKTPEQNCELARSPAARASRRNVGTVRCDPRVQQKIRRLQCDSAAQQDLEIRRAVAVHSPDTSPRLLRN